MPDKDNLKLNPIDGDGSDLEIEDDTPPSEYTCPYCNKTITYTRFTDYGKITFPYGEESGGDMDFPERVFTCPECDEELDYSKLQKAGVLP